MQDIGELYQTLIQQEFDGVSVHNLSIPMYSSTIGGRITDSGSLGAAYWRQNLESPVLFYDAVKSLLNGKVDMKCMLEVGPHAALAGPLRHIFKEVSPTTFYASCLSR